MMKFNETGFTLIEVMISVFILALGVIGAAGLQLTALRTSQQSAFQTIALELAAEMADKMRANDPQMRAADNPYAKLNYSSDADAEPTPPSTFCYGANANCSSAALAEFDIYEWERRIKAGLPGGRVTICRDASPWDARTGSFTWSCQGAASNSAALVIKIGWRGKNPDGRQINETGKQFPPGVVLAVEPYTR